LALAVSAVGTALAATATSQKITGKVCSYTGTNRCGEPRPLADSGAGTPIQLKIALRTQTTPPDSQAEPSTKAVVKFDNSIHVDTKGLKRATKSRIQSDGSTAAVRADSQLKPAQVGTGLGTVCTGSDFTTGSSCKTEDGGQYVPADVTFFNGPPTATGHPTLWIYASNDSLGGLGQTDPDPFKGVLTTRTGDLGNVLTVNPVGTPALGTLTSFTANLKKHWTYQGKGHDYLKAVCNDHRVNGKASLNYQASVTFQGVGTLTGNDVSKCT
jgi:hypothetical protein